MAQQAAEALKDDPELQASTTCPVLEFLDSKVNVSSLKSLRPWDSFCLGHPLLHPLHCTSTECVFTFGPQALSRE